MVQFRKAPPHRPGPRGGGTGGWGRVVGQAAAHPRPPPRCAPDPADRRAVLYGGCLAAANAVAAYALVRWSEHRPMRMFFRAILGGMGARMAGMLLAVRAGGGGAH